ncbi:hypothetical protein BBK36DRAFT_1161404 [Trichoderma citrinoviride]|uniref:AAA+ ATPase domain-containing protein n=1 Tax=Trichoderma citrinoviride TaxID=58853 RepID=A0A2T4B532_9HYPO|nr:hypothetical protein BBK36DRAFT_1161404 [Trichoderma citrinoviride]PTB64349.1 hypothetical protein BBK36DRAFT_1161404 [Trichoderma citrinoviride]
MAAALDGATVASLTPNTTTLSDITMADSMKSTIPASDQADNQQGSMEQLLLKLQQRLNAVEEDAKRERRNRERLERQMFGLGQDGVGDSTAFFDSIDDMNERSEELIQKTSTSYESWRRLRKIRENLRIIEETEKSRDTLTKKEQEWSTYCDVLKAQLQDARPGVQIPTLEEVNGITGNDSDDEDDSGKNLPNVVKAEVCPMSWTAFKFQQHGDSSRDLCVIEVLTEEPSITFDGYNNPWFMRYTEKSLNISTNGNTQKVEQKVASWADIVNSPNRGKQLMPERIRIRSINIIKILNNIFKTKAKDYRMNGAVVMIRPFRALVHYNREIRAKFAELKDKFGDDALKVQDTDGAKASAADQDNKPAEAKDKPSTGQDKPTDAKPDKADKEASDEEKPSEGNEAVEEDEFTSSLTAYQHLSCLIDFMDNTIQAKIDYLSGTQPRTISFNHLWYLFKPGDDVVGQGRRQAYRVISITSTGHKVTPPWRNWKRDESEPAASITLFCVYIDFDGKQLGPVSKSFVISKFDGEKAITALEVYPIRFAETPTATYQATRDDSPRDADPKASFQQELIDRGNMFIEVANVKHMHYNGFTLEARDEVDSQVMVDFAEAFAATQGNGWQPEIESLIGKDLGGSGSSEDETCSAACCAGEYIYNDNYVDKTRNENYIAELMPGPDEPNDEPSVAIYPRPLKEITATKGTLTKDDLIIMSYRVFGFVLRSRKWAKLDLKYLSPVSEGSKEQTAFDQLVLPKQHKDIVYCLVDQHFRNKEARVSDNEEVDIIRGKGKGLILLLHGSPGVGKTTTAEGVAERFNKPLFQITCGDLGATASEVEAALERNFSLANRWGCILLLDEADVFLAQRSPKNFVRNGLVAVFLRVLEYYAGILFLTTNRIGDFDEAFTSRIHISLYYPPLDKASTREIFRLNLRIIKQRFLDKGRDIDIHEKDILRYATAYWKKHENMRWNGRQIRNACQTALAMAEFDAQNQSTAGGGGGGGGEGGGVKKGVRDENAKVELTHLHVQIVSDAYLEFMRYLKSIYGFSADEVAKNMRLRAKHPKAKKDEEDDDDDTDDTSDDEAIYGPVKAGLQRSPSMPPNSAMSAMAQTMMGMPSMMNPSLSNTSHAAVSAGMATPSSTAESAAAAAASPQHMMQAPGAYMMANGPQGMYWMQGNPQQFQQGQNQQGHYMMSSQPGIFNPGQQQQQQQQQQMPGQNWPPNGNGNWPMMQNPMPSHGINRGNEGASPVAQS